jgi:RNA polymerase sigma-70 factor (ECF subfamily)
MTTIPTFFPWSPSTTDPSVRNAGADRPSVEDFVRDLMAEEAPALRSYVVRLMPSDPNGADDIVQETLLRAWQNFDQLVDVERFLSAHAARPWLFRVARNLAFDFYRRQSTRPPEVPSDGIELADGPALDRLDDVMYREMIGLGLRELSQRHREVLIYLYYVGMTQVEVAELLGIAQGTVKSRAHHAVAQARVALFKKGVGGRRGLGQNDRGRQGR